MTPSILAIDKPNSDTNNVGNIRHVNHVRWKGQTGYNKSGFVVFDTSQNAFRAMFILLTSYVKRGVNSLSRIINVYAPPNENDTDKYIDYVEARTGISRNLILTESYLNSENGKNFKKIVEAMSRRERGVAYSSDVIETGYSLFLKK